MGAADRPSGLDMFSNTAAAEAKITPYFRAVKECTNHFVFLKRSPLAVQLNPKVYFSYFSWHKAFLFVILVIF